LKHGADIPPRTTAFLGITTKSMPVLKWLADQQDSDNPLEWNSTPYESSPLSYALAYGATKEIMELLITEFPDKNTRNRFYSSLASGSRFTPQEKVLLAHRLLDAGLRPDSTSKQELKGVASIVYQSGDSSLFQRVSRPYIDIDEELRNLNHQLAWSVRTLGSIDSLIALGAHPLATTGGGCRSGDGKKDLTTPLEIRRGGGCSSDHVSSAFDWQALGHFWRRYPDRAGPELYKRDKLFIAVATGDLVSVQNLTQGKSGKTFIEGPDAVARGRKRALTIAAETGNEAMIRYLLGFQFEPKEREWALEYAVKTGSYGCVKELLNSGVDPQLPSRGKNGIVKLLQSMLQRRSGGTSQDTRIADLLLSRWNSPASSSFDIMENISRSSLPSSQLASVLKGTPAQKKGLLPITTFLVSGRKNNPVLFNHLWNYQPGPLDSDTLFRYIDGNSAILSDSVIMSMVSITGHEEHIIQAVIRSETDSPDKVSYDCRRIRRIIAHLNGLLDKGIAINAPMEPDWVTTVEEFQIGLDSKTRRFIPVWIVPSLFSAQGDFIGNYNRGYGE
jgi:hypothetical protein